jgi:hypothetical protein
MVELKLNEFALIVCDQNPSNNRYEFGPKLVRLEGPYERVDTTGQLPLLDQDDYIIVTDKDGIKTTVPGPGVYKPKISDQWSEKKNTVQVPVNCYMVLNDSNNHDHPVIHRRGPLKLFPEPFQVVTKDKASGNFFFPCEEVTQNSAIHIQRADGKVELLETPQYYMPEVGERVVKRVQRCKQSIRPALELTVQPLTIRPV